MPKKISTKKTEKKEESTKKLSPEEIKRQIIELAEKGITAEKIGEQLRQQRIHPKEHDIKISKILKEKGIYLVPDIKNISGRLERIRTHHKKYKQDKRAKREIERIASQLRKQKEYYKVQ